MAKSIGISFLVGFANGCLNKLFINDSFQQIVCLGSSILIDSVIFRTPETRCGSIVQAPAFMLGSGVVRFCKKCYKQRTIDYVDVSKDSANTQTLVQVDNPTHQIPSIASFANNPFDTITAFVVDHTVGVTAIVVVGISIGGYLLYVDYTGRLDKIDSILKEMMKRQAVFGWLDRGSRMGGSAQKVLYDTCVVPAIAGKSIEGYLGTLTV